MARRGRPARRLREQRVPRLLLVAPDAAPPAVDDEIEDWVRLPADARDVEVRARRLAHIAAHADARTRDDTRVSVRNRRGIVALAIGALLAAVAIGAVAHHTATSSRISSHTR